MSRFFAESLSGCDALLSQEEAHHAYKVLRLRDGDACQIIFDGRLYAGVFSDAVQGRVTVTQPPLPSPEPTVRFTLYQGIPKGDKMDMICQKCTEAGVSRIVPVQMKRCVAEVRGADAEKKRQRWQRIVMEAAKQSGRAVVPEVCLPVSFDEMLRALPSHALSLVPWEDARGQSVRTAFSGQSDVAAVIGPEGGIAPEEISRMPALPVTLGPRIFRTETAGLAALIEIMCLSGNMD